MPNTYIYLSLKLNGAALFIPVTDPALVAHRPLAVATVDVQCCRCLVQAGDGAARTQLDDLIGHVPQLKSLQQVYVGHVPVLLKWTHNSLRVSYSFEDSKKPFTLLFD